MSAIPKDLPPPEMWEHPPLCLWDRTNRRVCPIGEPFEFETPLFKGRLLLRVRDLEGTDQSYFEGRKRRFQFIMQGKFKQTKTVNALDAMIGCHYGRPFKAKPPALFYSIFKPFLLRLSPGLELDLISDEPYVFNNLVGAMQQILVHEEGETIPDMACIDDFHEHTRALGGAFLTESHQQEHSVASSKRKQIFAKAYRQRQVGSDKNNKQYVFESNKTYTFVNYEDKTDFVTYSQDFGMIEIDMVNMTHGEPFHFFCRVAEGGVVRTPTIDDGDCICNFQVWHKKFFESGNGDAVLKKGDTEDLSMSFVDEVSDISEEDEDEEFEA